MGRCPVLKADALQLFSQHILARAALVVSVTVLPARLTMNSGETVEG